jgi:hypothetical protein
MAYKDKEKERAYRAQYRAAHREERRKKQAEHAANHREEKRAYMRAYVAAHPEEYRARGRKSYAKNRAAVLARSAAYKKTATSKAWFKAYSHDPKSWPVRACSQIKKRTKGLDIEFNIRPEDLQVPSVCPFTLLPLDFGPKNGKPVSQSPSVDRINPDRGYVRGNVRVISLQANVAKSNITDPGVFQRLADDARLRSLV